MSPISGEQTPDDYESDDAHVMMCASCGPDEEFEHKEDRIEQDVVLLC